MFFQNRLENIAWVYTCKIAMPIYNDPFFFFMI